MDRTWLNLARDDDLYKKGIKEFVQFVRKKEGVLGKHHPCPCRSCRLKKRLSLEDIYWHLIEKGMMCDYKLWYDHGEVSSEPSIYSMRQDYLRDRRQQFTSSSSYCTGNTSVGDVETMNNPIMDLIHDAFPFQSHSMSYDGGVETNDEYRQGYGGNVAYEKYKKLILAAQTPISESSDETLLNYIVKLMQAKVKNRWSDKSVTDQLVINNPLLPNENKYPKSYKEVKKILKDLGMGYKNIHACVYGCVLYYKEYEELDGCPICNEPRYAQKGNKKVPNMVVKYFPLAPRLMRLYMSPDVAKEMRWHGQRDVSRDNLLRHPSDGQAWKDFDKEFPDFASDMRNVRLAISTDGFNPFGAVNIKHSTWPIVLMPLNLPPSMCMRREFNILSILIPGPDSPGKCLDVFMRPLIDELGMLWTDGVPTYDRHDGSSFQLRAAVLSTISDFPGLGMLAGHKVKGYRACPMCLDDIESEHFANRTCYQGHRRWLPQDHAWRENEAKFNGKEEHRDPPRVLSGHEILSEIVRHDYPILTNHPDLQPKKNKVRVCWSHKTMFYELPYWPSIAQPYSLDVMHIEKNVFENVVGTILGIQGKTKDGVKAREALRTQGVRQDQWVNTDSLPSQSKKPLESPFTVDQEHRKEILKWITEQKYPHGYAGSLKNKINVGETKFCGLKTHDCHVMMQRLIPVVIRPYLPSNVVIPIISLAKWFQEICCRELTVEDILRLKKEIVIILCKFEAIFPPTFFTIMVHLLIHLPEQILLKGPVHYSWMYPVERQLGEYKKYVRNTRYPEGCIAEQYIAQECVTYCKLYLYNAKVSVDEGISDIDFHISVSSKLVKPGACIRNMKLTKNDEDRAHWCVLDNCPEASYFVTKHKDKWYEEYRNGNSSACWKNFADSYFLRWITSLEKKVPISSYWKHELYILAAQPQMHKCYSQCSVNGVKFVVVDRDVNLVTQNSGVMVEAGDDEVYYGVVEQIIELNYAEGMNVVVFKCRWFNSTKPGEDGSIKVDHGLISIDTSSNWYADSPYCLALAARQVYYLDDPMLGDSWKVVNVVSHRGVFSDVSLSLNADIVSNVEEEAIEPYQEQLCL